MIYIYVYIIFIIIIINTNIIVYVLLDIYIIIIRRLKYPHVAKMRICIKNFLFLKYYLYIYEYYYFITFIIFHNMLKKSNKCNKIIINNMSISFDANLQIRR